MVEPGIDERITEIDGKIEKISDECDQAFEKWKVQMISSEEMSPQNKRFGNQLFVLKKERQMLLIEKNAPTRSNTEDVDHFKDRQELIIDKGSTETMCQCFY